MFFGENFQPNYFEGLLNSKILKSKSKPKAEQRFGCGFGFGFGFGFDFDFASDFGFGFGLALARMTVSILRLDVNLGGEWNCLNIRTRNLCLCAPHPNIISE